MNKFYCISELKQRLVDVWQSAAERYWRDHQRVEKETESTCASRWKTFWTLLIRLKSHGQMKCDLLHSFPTRYSFMAEFVIFRVLKLLKVRYTH